MTKYLKAKEVANLLGVNPRFVYKYAYELNGAKIGGVWFFTELGVDDAMQERRKAATSKHPSIKKTTNRKNTRKPDVEYTAEILESLERHGLADVFD